MMDLHIADVDYESLADAYGVSCVIFFSGCQHNCDGCQSPKTHNFNYGRLVTDELINEINKEIDKRPYISSIVLSGGDPMYSAEKILEILPKLHISGKMLWCFTGFTYEEICDNSFYSVWIISRQKLLMQCDVLVDGLFEIDKRDITLKYRGSSNQRIIDVKTSLKEKEIVLWSD